jgi:WD40 repeat protein
MKNMGGAGPVRQEADAEAGLMRNGARKWVLRAGHDLRGTSAPALLSMLCAAAFCPLIAVGTDITGAAAVAGMGVLSSVGGGVLADVITKAIDRLRRQNAGRSPSTSEMEEVLASEIGKVLAAGAESAAAMRAEIGKVLEETDLGGAILREAIKAGDEQLRSDLITAIDVLGSDFADLSFLVSDVAAAAASIQHDLDGQRANTRVIIEQNAGQSAEIRRAREDLALIERRTRLRTRGDDSDPGAEVRWEGCPYRGLLPFGEAEAEIFYGRERLTTDLAVMVAGQANRGGLIVVTGASGAGKSSLLRAGLLPALARGLQVQGSRCWPCRVMMPTTEPLTELATQLAALSGGDPLTIRDALSRDPGQAHLAARQAVLAFTASRRQSDTCDGAQRLVLIVDQFEQLFTLNAGQDREAERQRFITALRAMTTYRAGAAEEPPALVVIAVRGDFLDRCATYAELAVAMQENQFVVGPMTDSDLRVAITGPADAAGLHLEPALPETILGDLRAVGTHTAAGVLPLLSQAMLLTWENRDGDRLAIHGYGKSGGIGRAVEISADSVYDALPAADQVLAREILRNMITADRDARLARRPVARAALYGLPGSGQSRTDAVLDKFAAKRLIVLDEGTAEIAHDALLTAWPRLRGWLEEDQGSWSLHSQLAEDAEEWSRNGQPDFLYRGMQLAGIQHTASTWAANPDRYPALTTGERDFLEASGHANRRRIRQRRGAIGALLVLFIASLAGAGLATAAARSANHQRDLAASDELAGDSEQFDATDPITAAQLAAASWDVLPTAQARVSMLDALAGNAIATFDVSTNPGRSVNAVALSPGGSILAAADANGTVGLWDVATHQQIGAPITAVSDPSALNGGVADVAFSPGGKILVTAGGDGTVRLWDVASHQQIGAPIVAVAGLNAGVFGPDGKILATAGGDGTVRLWDVATHQQIGAPIPAVTHPSSNGGVADVAFSPDGKILAATGGSGTVRLWDVASHQQIGAPITAVSDPGRNSVSAVVFSPDGKILATGGEDGTARLWDVASHQQIGAPISYASNNIVLDVAFSPDGSTLATAALDGTARLWNVATHQQIGAPIPAVSDPTVNSVEAVAFSPDENILATGGQDGTARLWRLNSYGQIGAPITAVSAPSKNSVNAVVFSPDGSILATAGNDGTARLWDVATHQQIGTPMTALTPTPNGGVVDVAFSPSGKILATAGGDGTARLWDVATHQQIGAPITAVSDPSNDGLTAVAFSLDGKILATAAEDGTARLWDVATHQQIGAPITAVTDPSEDLVNAVVFSPDGKTLATAGSDGTARLWDVATHQQMGAPITAASEPVYGVLDVAFSPDGSILATTGDDGSVRLWDVATHQQIGAPITGASESSTHLVNAVAFSRDGEVLATAGDDGTARLWDVATHQQIGGPIAAVSDPGSNGGVLDVAFTPDSSILATAGGDGAGRLWDVGFPSNLLRAVCAIAGASLTVEQWSIYAQSELYQTICS